MLFKRRKSARFQCVFPVWLPLQAQYIFLCCAWLRFLASGSIVLFLKFVTLRGDIAFKPVFTTLVSDAVEITCSFWKPCAIGILRNELHIFWKLSWIASARTTRNMYSKIFWNQCLAVYWPRRQRQRSTPNSALCYQHNRCFLFPLLGKCLEVA